MIGTGLTRYRDAGLLLLRIGLGLAFMAHGWPKLAGGTGTWAMLGGAMGNLGIHFLPTFWGLMAALVEFVGGALLILGLAFRPACLLLTFQMLVAVLFHLQRGDAFGAGWSHALESGVVFLSLIFIGPGKYSLDGK